MYYLIKHNYNKVHLGELIWQELPLFYSLKKKVEICPPTGTSYKYNDMSNNEPKCKIVTALNLSQYEPKQQIKAYILA